MTAESERAAIVAWLREREQIMARSYGLGMVLWVWWTWLGTPKAKAMRAVLTHAANIIERGEHIKESGND
ncbi:MAG: hypothetical protein ACKVOB_13395 [Sphingomonas sp.]